jgi:hypothetical protein
MSVIAEKHTIRFEIGDGLLLLLSSEELPPPSHEVVEEITMIDTRKLLEVAIDKSLPFSQGVD